MKLMTFILSGLLLVNSFSAIAEESTPDVLVKNVSQEVLTIIKQDKDIQAGNQKKILELVDAKVLPYFNFTHMTALAMGRNWSKATPEQQKTLTSEFRTLLVRTYSNALIKYKDQTLTYKPFRGQPNDTDVIVRTQINQPGGQPVGIDYSMEKIPEGWKVYDVAVGGVSLVTNYRDSFASEVKDNGVDGLIKTLVAKNSSNSKADK
jgi:phospholipid transport system substrate-binding protein